MTVMFHIDGRILPEEEARVPAMDRGFLFGDGVYEVLRTRKGRLFRPDLHLARLRKSASRIRIPMPWPDEELLARVRETIEAAGNEESYVRVILTRGTGRLPNIDPVHAAPDPNLVILVRPLELPTPEEYARGASAWVVETLRNDRRAMDPAIKSGNYLNNILGLMEARDHGAEVALFLNAEGCLTEAPTSNVWIVRGGEILTPPPEAGILLGITRGLLLEMGRKQGLPVAERRIDRTQLFGADEIFLTSTLKDILPVTILNGRPVGEGSPGPLTRDLASRFALFADSLL